MNQENLLDFKVQLPQKGEQTIKEAIPGIIRGNTEQMISVARVIGHYIGLELPKKERLYLYQIRKIFGSVKRIQMESFEIKKLLLLKPQLVFVATKNDATMGIQYLKDVLIEAIDQVGEDENHFRNFIDFFEAILAYYQAAEKK